MLLLAAGIFGSSRGAERHRVSGLEISSPKPPGTQRKGCKGDIGPYRYICQGIQA